MQTILAVALERPGATADQGQYGEDFVYASVLDDVNLDFGSRFHGRIPI